jgi:hypothetical protein
MDFPLDLTTEQAYGVRVANAVRSHSRKFITAIAAPWYSCACCSRYRPESAIAACDDHALLEYHQLGHLPSAPLCSLCRRFRPSAARPACPLNRMYNKLYDDCIHTPLALQGLSYMEMQMIRLVVPFQSLMVLPGGVGLGAARGQVIHVANKPADMAAAVAAPLPLRERTLLVNQVKPNGSFTRYWRVSLPRIRRAMACLEQLCPALYAGQYAGALAALEELAQQDDEIDSREANDVSLPVAESVVFAELESGTVDLRTLPKLIGNPLRNTNDHVEELSFPDLFPRGRGGFGEPRPVALPLRDYGRSQLLMKSSKFQQNPSWLFRMLVLLYRHDMFGQISYIQRHLTPRHPNVEFEFDRSVTVGDVLRAARGDTIPEAQLLQKYYRVIGRRLRGSSAYWASAKCKLEAQLATLGPPTMFITLGSNDLHWLEFFQLVDPQRFKTDQDVSKLSDAERHEIVEKHCVLAAEHFKRRLRALIVFLKSTKAIGGRRVMDFFYRIEYQLRGAPHAHGLVWLEDVPDMTASEPEYLQWLDSAISCKIPDKEHDPSLHRLVQRYQIHRHTFTCKVTGKPQKKRRGQPPRKRRKQGRESDQTDDDDCESEDDARRDVPFRDPSKPWHTAEERKRFFGRLREKCACRFAFPRDPAAHTHRRTDQEKKFMAPADRDIIFARASSDQYVNNYNANILRIWQANMDIQPVSEPLAAAAYMMSYVTKGEKSESAVVREALAKLPPTSAIRDVCCTIGNTIIKNRQVSLQEAGMLILGEPLYRSSRASCWIDVRPPHERVQQTLPESVLESMNPRSTRIHTTRPLEHYERRPEAGPNEAFWSSMSAFEFFSWFEPVSKERKASAADDDEPGEDEDSSSDSDNDLDAGRDGCGHPPLGASDESLRASFHPNPLFRTNSDAPPFVRIPGQSGRAPPARFRCGTGREFRMRRRARCVRSRLRTSEQLSSMYTLLILYVPYRSELLDILQCDVYPGPGNDFESALLDSFAEHKQFIQGRLRSLPDTYAARAEAIICMSLPDVERRPFGRVAEEILPGPGDEFEPSRTRQAPNAQISLFCHLRLLSLPSSIPDLDEYQLLVVRIVQDYLESFERWRQSYRVWKADWHLEQTAEERRQHALSSPARPRPPRLFIHGAGGCGKSFLIRALCQQIGSFAARLWTTDACPSGGVLLAAPTGVAACNISGTTLHQLFALPVERQGWAGANRLSTGQLEALRRQQKNALVTIIDEVSMVGANLFALVNQRMNDIFAEDDAIVPEAPDYLFGARVVLLFGDLCQLPPVKKKTIFSDHPLLTVGTFHLFKSVFYPIELRGRHRQAGDLQWGRVLDDVRKAVNLDEAAAVLRTRVLDRQQNPRNFDALLREYQQPVWQNALHLYPTHRMVAERNAAHLQALARSNEQPIYVFRAQDVDLGSGQSLTPEHQQALRLDQRSEDSTAGLVYELRLTFGSRVMIRQNIDVSDGLYNGLQGYVVDFAWPEGFPPPRRHGLGVILLQSLPLGCWVQFDSQDAGRRHVHRFVEEDDGTRTRQVYIQTCSRDFNPTATGQRCSYRRSQLPFIPSAAATIHKSQSMTLDRVVIHGAKMFQPGQGYVAYSRARTLRGVLLTDFDPRSLRVSQPALDEYERLDTVPGPGPLNGWGSQLMPVDPTTLEGSSYDASAGVQQLADCASSEIESDSSGDE